MKSKKPIGSLHPGDLFDGYGGLSLMIAIDASGCNYILDGVLYHFQFRKFGHTSRLQYDYSATTVLVLKSV